MLGHGDRKRLDLDSAALKAGVHSIEEGNLMRNILASISFTAGLSLAAFSAQAGGCIGGSSGVVSFTGLGDEGFACSQQPFRPASPALRVFIVTGDDPSAIFTITVDVSPIVNSNSFGGPRFGLCGAPLPTTTDPSYAWGYAIPDWPDVFFDSPKEDANGKTVTIRGRVRDLLNWKPYSNYTLNIVCTPRIF